VTVTCAVDGDGLRVGVRDDGCGFAPDRAAPDGRWGLVGMRERAAAVAATLDVESATGRGTTVRLVVPAGAIGPQCSDAPDPRVPPALGGRMPNGILPTPARRAHLQP
jgi:signal transduction histidine kinase